VVTPLNFRKGLKVKILPCSGYVEQFTNASYGVICYDTIGENGWCSVEFYDKQKKFIGENTYRVASHDFHIKGFRDDEGLYYDLYIHESEDESEKFKNILSGENITI